MVRMATPELLPFCQLQYFPTNLPKALVVRGNHVVTKVNLHVNRMAAREYRESDGRGSVNSFRALSLSLSLYIYIYIYTHTHTHTHTHADWTNTRIVRCAYAKQHSNY